MPILPILYSGNLLSFIIYVVYRSGEGLTILELDCSNHAMVPESILMNMQFMMHCFLKSHL